MDVYLLILILFYVSLREWTLYNMCVREYSRGYLHTRRNRLPMVHRKQDRSDPADCTVTLCLLQKALLPPMSKNVSFIGVKIGEDGDGAFPSWKCWYRFFSMEYLVVSI